MLVYIDSTIVSDLHLHPLHHHQCAKYIGFNWKSLVLWTICVIRNYMPLLYLGFFSHPHSHYSAFFLLKKKRRIEENRPSQMNERKR